MLGTQVLAFGMTWTAGSISGTIAGLVLTAIVLPRVLLLLVGGAVADRAGAWAPAPSPSRALAPTG